MWVNGTRIITLTHDAANQVVGYSYDAAGNLTSDGAATYVYDALSRTTAVTVTATSQTRHNSYTGDGVLLKQVANGITTRFIQDLAAPLSQMLQTTGPATTNYLYGLDRLATRTGSLRTWYLHDGLGSVRRTLNDTGASLGVIFYDPWGTVESGTVPTFGFTGELHDTAAGLVNLRARWYSTGKGTFTAHRWRTNESNDRVPYSHHGYAYALSNPATMTDPAGTCAVDDAGSPRACNPAELSFEEQLVAVLDNYGPYAHLYDAATMSRGANPLNLVFDRNPDQAQTYQPGNSLRSLVEEKYPFLDSEGVVIEVTRALGTWRLDALSRGVACNNGSALAPAGMIAGAVILLGGPDEFLSPDRGGTGGEPVRLGIKGQIRKAQLPTEGRIRFVPPEGATTLRKGPNNGYIDRFGNEWVHGPSRTPGEPFEWDVQLSREGKNQLGWLSRDGSHVNVSLGGHVTHR